MTHSISVVIIVKNDPGIEHTLSLLHHQENVPPFEIIVVDASSPEKLAYIRDKNPGVQWVSYDQRGKRFTIPEQRNLGIQLAKGDLIFFIDANCQPKLNWMATMLDACTNGEDIVCGPCTPSNKTRLVKHSVKHSRRTYVEECATRNVLLRRTVIEKVGIFDTALSYGEDVDYFWRARDLGFKICYEPNATVTHDYGDAREELHRAYLYGKSRARLYIKHHTTRRLRYMLTKEPHVWIYPLYILLLPLTFFIPFYPLVILLLAIKNRSIGVVTHHLVFGWGVLVGALRLSW